MYPFTRLKTEARRTFRLSPARLFLQGAPCPLCLLMPRTAGASPADPQSPMGYSVTPSNPPRLFLQPCPGSTAFSYQARAFCCFFPQPPQLPQGARTGPWKPRWLSQGLSKTRSVCPLPSQAVKAWTCLPELRRVPKTHPHLGGWPRGVRFLSGALPGWLCRAQTRFITLGPGAGRYTA